MPARTLQRVSGPFQYQYASRGDLPDPAAGPELKHLYGNPRDLAKNSDSTTISSAKSAVSILAYPVRVLRPTSILVCGN